MRATSGRFFTGRYRTPHRSVLVPSVAQKIHDWRPKTFSSPQTAGGFGNPHQLRFQWVIIGEVVGVMPLPYEMAGAAKHGDGLGVEESPLITPVMCIQARSPADVAPAVVTPINEIPHTLPLF